MVERRAIADASPLIILHHIGRFDLLGHLYRAILVPHGVISEIAAGPDGTQIQQALEHLSGYRRFSVTPDPRIIEWDLGMGETEVLTAAKEHRGSDLLLDDKAARKCATTFGYPVKGTLALLMEAKRNGLIDSLAVVIDELNGQGFWISDSLRRQALLRVGE
jgi:predicted nucleic acid-binding protein